ncbi:hypothetical protein V865_003880 [Kwoniella europaea PYCC6329]|uniref:Uncharacterized protein n=1 Tax=Kwoniella europaea PYCC6329 TaxID=1423913 RepID=A0AAX4KJ81_9TREE
MSGHEATSATNGDDMSVLKVYGDKLLYREGGTSPGVTYDYVGAFLAIRGESYISQAEVGEMTITFFSHMPIRSLSLPATNQPYPSRSWSRPNFTQDHSAPIWSTGNDLVLRYQPSENTEVSSTTSQTDVLPNICLQTNILRMDEHTFSLDKVLTTDIGCTHDLSACTSINRASIGIGFIDHHNDRKEYIEVWKPDNTNPENIMEIRDTFYTYMRTLPRRDNHESNG